MVMKLPKGYVGLEDLFPMTGEPFLYSYQAYLDTRGYRERKKWKDKIAIEDEMHRKHTEVKDNLIKMLKDMDAKQRGKRYYIPDEQEYNGVEYIFDVY